MNFHYVIAVAGPIILALGFVCAPVHHAALAQPEPQVPNPESPGPSRPPILGVAHIGLKTDDLGAARKFYGDILGFQEPFTVDKPTGGLMLTYFKVNDYQYIEVFPELKSATEDRLSHIAFLTTDAQKLRDYLRSRGVAVPATLHPGLDGNLSFMVKDPDGRKKLLLDIQRYIINNAQALHLLGTVAPSLRWQYVHPAARRHPGLGRDPGH